MAPGSKAKYGNLLKEAQSIHFKYLGIRALRWRCVVTREIVLEIPGKVRWSRAEKLASKLKYVFQGKEKICVAHSLMPTEISLSGLDVSITSAVVINAVAASEGCRMSDVTIGVILRRSPMASI